MNVNEIILMYQITDPVYQGLIKWRMEMVNDWYEKYMNGALKDVLEIGTGNFPFTLGIGQSTKKINFLGLERDLSQQERAAIHVKDNFLSAEMRQSMWNAKTASSLGPNKYDLVTSFEVFEHVSAKDEFIKNVAKVLKPGGFAIIETPNTEVTPLFEQVFGHSPDGAGDYEGNAHVNELSFRDLFQDFRRNGFEIIDFNNYYLPVSLWQDAALDKYTQTELYQRIHRAAAMFPFYSYVQAFLAQKK